MGKAGFVSGAVVGCADGSGGTVNGGGEWSHAAAGGGACDEDWDLSGETIIPPIPPKPFNHKPHPDNCTPAHPHPHTQTPIHLKGAGIDCKRPGPGLFWTNTKGRGSMLEGCQKTTRIKGGLEMRMGPLKRNQKNGGMTRM